MRFDVQIKPMARLWIIGTEADDVFWRASTGAFDSLAPMPVSVMTLNIGKTGEGRSGCIWR